MWASVCRDPPLTHRGYFSSHPACCFQGLLGEESAGAVDGYFASPATNPRRPCWTEAFLCIPGKPAPGDSGPESL